MKNVALKSPLLGDAASDYLNSEAVRLAMNIPDTIQAWEGCSGPVQNVYHMQTEGSLWIYKVLKNKYKIMFYSGDTDGAVPLWGSRQWID